MRSALLLLVFVVACGDNLTEPGDAASPPTDNAEAAGIIDTSIDSPPDSPAVPTPPTCHGTCFELYADNATFPPTRPGSGNPWDSDGTLPEPVMHVFVNGVEVGMSSAKDPSTFLYYDFGAYRADWNEMVAAVPLSNGDAISMTVNDAQEGYEISNCGFKVSATTFDLAQNAEMLLCYRDVGQISVGFQKVTLP